MICGAWARTFRFCREGETHTHTRECLEFGNLSDFTETATAGPADRCSPVVRAQGRAGKRDFGCSLPLARQTATCPMVTVYRVFPKPPTGTPTAGGSHSLEICGNREFHIAPESWEPFRDATRASREKIIGRRSLTRAHAGISWCKKDHECIPALPFSRALRRGQQQWFVGCGSVPSDSG